MLKVLIFGLSFLCSLTSYSGQQNLAVDMHDKPLVDFLIIGAQKSGTTALHNMLKQHPQICMGSKEVHYFDRYYNQGAHWYKNALPERETINQLVGEKTPFYLFHPRVPKRTHKLLPDVKLIILLRNPADRAYSHYWHNQRMNIEPLSFEEAISSEWTRLAGEKKRLIEDSTYHSKHYQHYSYLSRGMYLHQIKQWLDFFPRDRMLILSSSDLKYKEKETLDKIFHFLGLESYPVRTPQRLERKYPPINPETRKQLIEFFEPFNKELEEFLEMEFNWK